MPPTGFDECAELKKTLALARRALAHLEQQQTGLGQMDVAEKRDLVARLRAKA